MRTKVTWRNKNPFCPLHLMGKVSEADLTDDTTIEIIEQFAKDATPEMFWLHKIEINGEIVKQYSYMEMNCKTEK